MWLRNVFCVGRQDTEISPISFSPCVFLIWTLADCLCVTKLSSACILGAVPGTNEPPYSALFVCSCSWLTLNSWVIYTEDEMRASSFYFLLALHKMDTPSKQPSPHLTKLPSLLSMKQCPSLLLWTKAFAFCRFSLATLRMNFSFHDH